MGTFNTGSAPAGILERALTGNIFQDMNLAFMNEGDKDGYNVYKHDMKNTLSAFSVDPSVSITNTLQKNDFKRDLVIVETKESFDPADYHQHWLSYQPSGEFLWEGLPAEVQSSLEDMFLGSSIEATGDALTNGNATVGVTGLIPQLLSTVYTDLAGTPATPTQVANNTAISFRAHGGGTGDRLGVAITTTNIFQKLELLIKNQSKAMRKRNGKKFMVSYGTADIFREALRLELNFKGVDVTEAGITRYSGYEIIENEDFPDDTILFCSMTGSMQTDAIQMGTSSSSDKNNLVVDRLSRWSREWMMLLRFAIDIFVVRPEEICFYTTETVA